MTNTAAYDAGLPCKNPNCKSHGKPHPNCKCYFGGEERRAEGGEIGRFCDSGKAHESGCEHYAGGGTVSPAYAESVGADLLSDATKRGLFPTQDGIGTAMMDGNNGDHSGAVANLLAHLGASKFLMPKKDSSSHLKLKANENLKLLSNKSKLLTGIGAAAHGMTITGNKHAKNGSSLFKNGPGVPISHDEVKPVIEDLLGYKVKSSVAQHLIPAVIKVLSSPSSEGLYESIDHAKKVNSGHQSIEDAISSLFGDRAHSEEPSSEKEREQLREFVENGELGQKIQSQLTNDQSSFAQGGEVPHHKSDPILSETDHVSKHWPAQSMMLGIAKGRINNYLNSIRPLQSSQLPYDTHHEDPLKKRGYDKALDLANRPLDILNHIKKNTLGPDELKHFTSMYPELHSHLSKKITEKIADTQLKGEKPSYQLRQSLSYFLGSPLNKTFTPAFIQAAQSVFIQQKNKQAPPEQATKPKKGTSGLSDYSEQFQTTSQASIARQRNS